MKAKKILFFAFAFMFLFSLIFFVQAHNVNAMNLKKGLVAYYTLNGTTGSVIDSTGNHDGTNQGATRGVSGKINNSFSFGGDGDYVDLGFNTITTAYTIQNYIQSSILHWYIPSGIQISTPVTASTWTYFVATGNQTGTSIYLNGVKKQTTTNNIGVDYSVGYWFYANDVTTQADTFSAHNANFLLGKYSSHYYNGKIDEVGIYNRSLSQAEITYLYNNGTGRTYPFYSPAQITLKAPANNSVISSSSVTFNATINPGKSDDGSQNRQVASWNISVYNSTSIFDSFYVHYDLGHAGKLNISHTFINLKTENYTWNVKSITCSSTDFGLCSQPRQLNSTKWTFVIDTTPPKINLTYPLSSTDLSLGNNQNLTIQYNITGARVDSGWFNFANKNYTLNVSATNYTFEIQNITGLVPQNITLYANDTVGNTISLMRDLNWTLFDYNNYIYKSPVLESTTNKISNEFYIPYGLTQAYLIYNNSKNIVTLSNTNNIYNISANILAPAVQTPQNISFHYQLIINGKEYNLTTQTQRVLPVSISSNCSAGNNPFLNFTNYNEKTLEPMVGTVEYYIVLKNKDVVVSLANGTTTGKSSEICSSQNLSSFSSTFSAQLRYYADGFATKTYNIQNNPINNTEVTIPLYYLNSSLATKFNINYVDFNYAQKPGALIKIERQYLSSHSFNSVEIPIITSNGGASGTFSTNNIRYRLVLVDNGKVIDTFENIFPTCQNVVLGQCDLNLRGHQETTTTAGNDFTYTITKGVSSLILNYNIPSGTPRTTTFSTQQNSRFLNNITTCSKSQFSSAGSMTCFYNSTLGDSVINVIITNNDQTYYGQVSVSENLNSFFLLNNYFIAFMLLLSLGLIFIASGTFMVASAAIGILFLGAIFLLQGMSLTTVATGVIWLIIAAVLIIIKISRKEETT